MDAIAQTKLHQDALDMRLDGRLFDHERRGDLTVREPAGNQLQDFTLAGRKLVEPVVG